MISRALADATVVAHALFVVFVLLGGALVLRWPRIAILHLPAAVWGVWVEFTGSVCPLTPLENEWRRAAGEAGYPGGFLEHYLVPILYPDALTPRMQAAFGIAAVAVNVSLYGLAWLRARRRRRSARGSR